jgi:hypothetical protein
MVSFVVVVADVAWQIVKVVAVGVVKVAHFGDAVVAVVAAADVARQNVGGAFAGVVVSTEGCAIVMHIVDAFGCTFAFFGMRLVL